jgi:Na+-transporting NADH:ubiquinone oxidoreductase subunit NqrE
VVFAQAITQALHFVSQHTAREIAKAVETKSAPLLIDLIVKVATRFEIQVGRKALSQLVPGIGAGLGAVLNVVFMRHFNDTAKYHFGLRRLEREFGAEEVRRLYQEAAKAERARHTS